ncbi:MAG: gliding motility-associated C-terminal domain-containing protein [Saprospiraceae bacterium]
MRNLYLTFLLLAGTGSLFAQAPNDVCDSAIELTNLVGWCSQPAAFSNANATDEATVEKPYCFFDTDTNRDIWFSFTAIGNTINISVTGDYDAGQQDVGGTLRNPNIALYSGTCGKLTEVECVGDGIGINTVNTLAGPLAVGSVYYIRVSAQDGNDGTFQLCVNNYNSVPAPSGDCEPGVILCDKSPFSVEQVSGAGNNPNELTGIFCQGGGAVSEFATSWYKWTCDQPGSLTFTLTPLNPADDLDFYLFRLPNGIDDCSGKILLRSMSSGEQGGAPFSAWEPCTGQTGMSLTDNDVSEDCGCQAGDNNFVAGIDMDAGVSYALVISNFSNSGSGFSIEFGGTGTFLGPTADFEAVPQSICVGQAITFTDRSSYVGNLVGWAWNFGPDANNTTASGQGPHTVEFHRPGLKGIQLTVEAERGCIVTATVPILVECCANHFNSDGVASGLVCPGTNTGSIDLEVSSNYPPLSYNWSTGDVREDVNGLPAGDYSVSVVDDVGCSTELSFTVDSPPDFVFDTLVTMPTCNGGTDGAVTLAVSGGTPDYEYNWESSGFGPDNTLSNISQGDYSLVVRDMNGCETDMLLPVRELELILDPMAEAITPPSCFGFSDGRIQLNIDNGLPAYQYNFNDGNGFVNSNTRNNLSSGVYTVDVRDANLCKGAFTFTVEDHPPLELEFDPTNISCFGLSDGTITALPVGGVGNYAYNWQTGTSSETLDGLPAGSYAITVLDGNGCEIDGVVTLTQPNQLFLDIVDILDNICFGDEDGEVQIQGSGGTGPYEYSADGLTFQSSTSFGNLPAGNYTFTILDALGCTETTDATVNQPAELTVDAGEDQTINLGYSTTIRALPSDPLVTYSWSPDQEDIFRCLFDDCQSAEVMPLNSTIFEVTVTDLTGCIATDSVRIGVIKNRPLYIPNAFSPNNDGPNDYFTIYAGPSVESIQSLQIFDRWGELVFSRQDFPPNDESMGWDGTFNGQLLNPGVFVYMAEVRFIDGFSVRYKGDVTLVR